MKELPGDFIVEILYRLPIKSLIRFSCVSKRWFWLIITDQYLAKSHFRFASAQESLTRRFLLSSVWLLSHMESLDLENLGLYRTLTPPPFKSVTDDGIRTSSWPPFDSVSDILGSCHGLICISFTGDSALDTYIWNPSTGFSKKLPDPGFGDHHSVIYSGFGYSSAKDDYKLVVAVENVKLQVAVFSCRTSIWTRIDDDLAANFKEKVHQPAAVLREKLHWFNNESSSILTFDLANEEFHVLPPPPYKDSLPGACACACTSYGGLLYVLCSDGFPSDLWVMREYGAGGSWTKLFNNVAVHYTKSDRTFLTAETTLVMAKKDHFCTMYLRRVECKIGQPAEGYFYDRRNLKRFERMIMYEESLLRLPEPEPDYVHRLA